MEAASPIARVAGATPVRLAVNQGFHAYARRRTRILATRDPVEVQRQILFKLLRTARSTRFGLDHGFASIRSVEDFQSRVPLRTYEALWDAYLKDKYPRFDDLTWPGHIPYLALTSGTTQGATKYIPVSWEMVASNRKAAKTMVAYHLASRPKSRLFQGRIFLLGGSTNLERPAQGVRQGDLSGIAAEEAGELLRPYTFPPLDLALESDWDKKAGPSWPSRSIRETDHPDRRRAELASGPVWSTPGPDRQVDDRRGLAEPGSRRAWRRQV